MCICVCMYLRNGSERRPGQRRHGTGKTTLFNSVSYKGRTVCLDIELMRVFQHGAEHTIVPRSDRSGQERRSCSCDCAPGQIGCGCELPRIEGTFVTLSLVFVLSLLLIMWCFAQLGWTALILAATKGHLEVVKVLLQAGANVKIMDKVSV